ncbi:Uncharacterised protein [Shigella sonnei]|nr:Uncharacterised protein [Shigella sonnei]
MLSKYSAICILSSSMILLNDTPSSFNFIFSKLSLRYNLDDISLRRHGADKSV